MNMKYFFAASIVLFIFINDTTFAQKHIYRKGKMARSFNQSTVETINGKILKINLIVKAYYNNQKSGIHIRIRTSKETINAHLGPARFINKHIALKKNDKVEIEGSRIKYAFKDIIIAKSIKKGTTILILRNDKGVPVWSGMGWRAKNR